MDLEPIPSRFFFSILYGFTVIYIHFNKTNNIYVCSIKNYIYAYLIHTNAVSKFHID